MQFVKSKISASQIRGRVRYLPLGIYRYGNATWKPLGVRLPGRVPDFRIKWRTLSCGRAVNLWPLRRGRLEMVSSTFELVIPGEVSISLIMSLLQHRDARLYFSRIDSRVNGPITMACVQSALIKTLTRFLYHSIFVLSLMNDKDGMTKKLTSL